MIIVSALHITDKIYMCVCTYKYIKHVKNALRNRNCYFICQVIGSIASIWKVCIIYKLLLNENLTSANFLLTLVLFILLSELKMWDHRSGDFYQRQHVTCSLGGWFPGYACEEGPSCWTDEATQAGQRGEYALFCWGTYHRQCPSYYFSVMIVTIISATPFRGRVREPFPGSRWISCLLCTVKVAE